MLVPLSWLKKYVPITIPPKELAHRLTMAGTEVAAVREIGADWDKILVGRVIKLEPHPNADRLTLPTVDLGGGEAATVVCGAPNVAEGQKIAFAREGARLFSSRSGKVEELKSAKIRGVVSAGMVCSSMELGLGEGHTGILVLDDSAPVGTPLADHLGDTILDIEVTPNRPDCLSILGVAHEVAAVTGEGVTEPQAAYVEEGPPIEGQAKIEIADPDLCPRYTASLVKEVKVGPSPAWLQDALTRMEQRPINNIVDITNYVMLEYGQPLHAFDFDLIKDSTIIVRPARHGERLTTLDDETRTLKPPMLAIADADDAVALAGVIGGAETGVTEGTTSVLLESAKFDPINTRRTAAELRLSTEASYRFERGIRAELAPLALKRATQLVLQVAGGKAAEGIVDVYPGRKESPAVQITGRRTKQVLGVDFSTDEVERVLKSLGFERAEKTEDGLLMRTPYWRSDIAIEDDLIEEVARIAGYDNIPTTTLSTPIPHHEPHPAREVRERLREALAASGMQEVISYSLTSRRALDNAGALSDGVEPIRIANPMSSEVEFLRTSLRGSLLETLSSNLSTSRSEGFRLFEIGNVYLPKEDAKEGELPDEKEMLVGVISGPRFQTSWLAPPGDMNFFDAKGLLDAALRQVGVKAEFEPSEDPILHPGKTARLASAGEPIGVIGEVHPEVLDLFDLEGSTTAMFEIDLDALYPTVVNAAGGYLTPSRFPESERDLALIVDADVPAARVQSIIDLNELVRSSSPFDVYIGEGIPAGKKSIAFRAVFQSPTTTLTAEQVDVAQAEILRQLRSEVGAELRQ